MLKGFKDFIMRGNVIDLAVGIIIGAAFTEVVNALVNNILNPLIGAIFGKPDLSGLWNITLRAATETQEASVLSVGGFLNAVLQFLIVAAALYFAIVMPLNRLAERRKKGEEPEPEAPAEDVLLLQEIRDLLVVQNQNRG
ncbi:large conductance mechanosensitive channel protein MscL [Isoptericola variabilis]|uniref:Large-conductance mechanosensitive channel n=1 Tax=Isoptericola variabilis (strain 225) TaxID=743718 RepID=F6FT79_ISOV2|nr:large conductance mechanosensitive channel protein MscL [Isoptericola variabilis]AEG45243.1 Large-conductance mechanosensitive channel [Isoptericola variabilis 225]TWH30942.1 large conductance mechanosensitive channel [Isoptericola variabilis J7]